MKHTYIIVEDNEKKELEIREIMRCFPDFLHVQSAFNFDDALNAILKYKPSIVFLKLSPEESINKISLFLISEVHRFLTVNPRFIVISNDASFALEAISYNVFDYLLKPIALNDLRKSLLKFEKSYGRELFEEFSNYDFDATLENLHEPTLVDDHFNIESHSNTKEELQDIVSTEKPYSDCPLIICIKSYGDHKYIDSSSVWYLKADNNSTDLFLNSGEVITAFKTLKSFENALPFPFVRIHNSFIVNVTQISRIHVGNSFCYIRNTSVKIPFSKSYKNNVEKLLSYFEDGNYIEF